MAWSAPTTLGGNGTKTAGTTLSLNPSPSVPAGAVLIVTVYSDNIATANGSSDTVTGCTDSRGNSYTKLIEWTRSDGAAGDGATVAVFVSRLQAGLATTDAITVTWSASLAARQMHAQYRTVDAGNTWALAGAAGAHGTSSAPAVTLSGLSAITRAWHGAVSGEGTATWTHDADYTQGRLQRQTSGGNALSNNTGVTAARTAALSSDTFDPVPSTSLDWAAVLVALDEVPAPITGSLHVVLEDVTSSGSAQVAITGSLDVALDGASAQAQTDVLVSGSLEATLEDVLAAADALVQVAGSLDVLLQDATLEASGTVSQAGITGTLDVVLEDATLAASGAVGIGGDLAAVLEDATLEGSGTVAVTGQAGLVLEDALLEASGGTAVTGVLDVTLGDATLDAAGGVAVGGSLDVLLEDLDLAASALVDVVGGLDVLLEDASLEASGVVGTPPITGTLDVTLEDATLISGAAVMVTGSLEAGLEDAGLAAGAGVGIAAGLEVTLEDAVLSGSALVGAGGGPGAGPRRVSSSREGEVSGALPRRVSVSEEGRVS